MPALYNIQSLIRTNVQTSTMAPSQILDETLESEPHKCDLPLLNPERNVSYFDVQPAEPGTFTVPGVIDLEVYEPGSLVETSWIYFKGDPMAGPQPGHPFEMPFNNSVNKFSIDVVKYNDTPTVIHQLMRGSKFCEATQANANCKRQRRRILLHSGKVVYLLVETATTHWSYRDWIALANTTTLA